MTPAEALASLIAIKNNEMALADPTGALWSAHIAFFQSVVEAVSAQNVPVQETQSNISPGISPTDEQNSAAIAALEAENADLTAKVEAGQKAIDAFDAIIHPQATADAAPSSSEPATIAPQAPA